ncbi:MAG: hypothetical protein IPK85_01465 [Gemmatimonadetes bacterium]|nr:hypothetical protein [Gemmatimonadota bacterium]
MSNLRTDIFERRTGLFVRPATAEEHAAWEAGQPDPRFQPYPQMGFAFRQAIDLGNGLTVACEVDAPADNTRTAGHWGRSQP